MRHSFALGLLALACAFAPVTADAQQAQWRLAALEGNVWVRLPGESASNAQLNQTLPNGAIITTGASSRATVQNGAQRVVMTPNSRMTIPERARGVTRILQDMGAIIFEVNHEESPHFQVETPLLAAVVKGTRFTVSVGEDIDSVSVEQGVVEVRANAGTARHNLEAGATAFIRANAPADIVLQANSNTGLVLRGREGETPTQAAQATGAVQGSSVSQDGGGALVQLAPTTASFRSGGGGTSVFEFDPRKVREQGGLIRFIGSYFAVCLGLGLAAFVLVRLTRSRAPSANLAKRNRPAA